MFLRPIMSADNRPGRMQIQEDITAILQQLAAFAAAFQRKLSWFIGAGMLASSLLVWMAYSADSSLWWNAVKCGAIMLPSLIWCFIWSLLGQLREAPVLAAALASRKDGVIAAFNDAGPQEKMGVHRVFSTLRAFRDEQGLGIVLDTIGNVTLLGNPLFAAFAFIMIAVLLLFIMITPLILLL